MKTKTLRSDSGMTLLELMFASAIVGVALAFLFGSLVSVSLASNITQNRGIAATHLATVMEELNGMDFNQLLVYTPPVFQNLGPGEVIRLQVFRDDGTAVDLPVDPTTVGPLPNPLLVRCVVNWVGAENRPLTLEASQFFRR